MAKCKGSTSGKVTPTSIFVGVLMFCVAFSVNIVGMGLQVAQADDVTTTVTVLNTPPVWSVDAEESSESSATLPTNSGDVLSIVGTGDDSNGDDYFLLVCTTGVAPTANASNPPSCDGGLPNQIAVSASTTDETQATAATTTTEIFAESNAWFAWICDANATLPKCNTDAKQGTGSTASPFIVNHEPTFSIFFDDSPTLPGALVTWYSTSSDSDTVGGNDTVQLFVCKADDFTGSACGAGGEWASSTLYASDPEASTTIAIPTQDQNYSAFGFIIDNHGHSASLITSLQGTDSTLTVANATPTVGAATISLNDTDDVGNLELLTPFGTTSDFTVKFTAVDDNSCLNAGAGDELASAIANVYRSGVTSALCDEAGEFDSNDCYVNASPLSNIVCSQDVASCGGSSDTDATWTCTFELWYNADPTDGADLTDSTWWAENWIATVEISDDNYATSTPTESSTGNEVVSFLAFDVATTSIAYGGLEPGQQNDPIVQITDLSAIGNVGLDEDLYGDGMCTTWSAPDSCPVSPTGTIPVGEQVFATSSVAYALGIPLTASTSPTELEIDILKTISTSSPASGNTYWGIRIPGTITLAGAYQGQDTITAIKGEAQQW